MRPFDPFNDEDREDREPDENEQRARFAVEMHERDDSQFGKNAHPGRPR